MNFSRVLQTGHSRCWTNLGIFRPIELGSSRSSKGDVFLCAKAPEPRLLIFVIGSYMLAQCAADDLLLVKPGTVPKMKIQLTGESAQFRPRAPTYSARFIDSALGGRSLAV